MSRIFSIVADGEVHWDKLIPILIFGAIWLLGQVLSTRKKSNSRSKLFVSPPVPQPPPVARSSVSPMGAIAVTSRLQPQKGRRARRVPPLPPKAAPAAPQPYIILEAEPAPTTSVVVTQYQRPNLRLRAHDLRSQFILTEILKPPVALRTSDERQV